MSTVFAGTIVHAWPDMRGAPQVALRVEANTGQFDAVKPADPLSYSGNVDAAQVHKDIAAQMGRVPENNGVSMILSSPYFFGSARNKMIALARMGRFAWLDDNENILAIWPINGSRQGDAGIISKDTGMVGYPESTANGVLVTTLFNRAIQAGGNMTIKSDIQPANGTWHINRVDYDLESMVPRGAWFARLYGSIPGNAGSTISR
jgi:hypothetical protein